MVSLNDWLPAESGVANDMQPLRIKAAVMTNARLSQESFPTECPRCHQATGMVCKASTVLHEPSIIRLTVRCATCKHDWVIDAAGEPSYVGEAFYETQDARIQYR